MDGHGLGGPAGVDGVVVYDRRSVEQFFAAACERRARLLSEIAIARRRIVGAESALAAAQDVDARLTQVVLDAYRQMNEDLRANKRRIVQALTAAAAEAESIATATDTQVAKIVELQSAPDRSNRVAPEQPLAVPHAAPRVVAAAAGASRGHERRYHPGGAARRPAAPTAKAASAPSWTSRF